MNRPWVIWCLSGLIALLVFGAMGVITRHTLGLEMENAQAEARAELEGRTRIALWRMDTYAAGILAEENNRPAWHFRDVDMRGVRQLSPLNVDVPENVNLHFEYRSGQFCSPQINGWAVGSEVWDARLVPVQQGVKLSAAKKQDFEALKRLFYEDDTYKGWLVDRNPVIPLQDGNLGMANAVAANYSAEEKKIDEKVVRQARDKAAVASEQRVVNPKSEVRSVKGYQDNYNDAERAKRQEIVQKSIKSRGVSKKKPVPRKPLAKKPLDIKPEQADAVLVPGAQAQKEEPVVQKDVVDKLLEKADAVVEGAYQAPLHPLWIGDELVLVREVQDSKGKRLQGVWLNAGKIQSSLLANIDDLLPDARLEPVRLGVKSLLGEEPDPSADDPMVLAALPWRLIPGEVAVAAPVSWTPMRKTLAVAWVGSVLAALAAMVLLRGVVKLSERRASFVSSVTHELRTPLTTFSLYSDMLAEGMVRDEGKKQVYLDTLRKESARLTHLVENVLAYSRIERGSARARVEEVEIGGLVERMCDRLSRRADEDGMELRCEVPEDLQNELIEVDTTAVEQIIFNLVDNASKYASGEGCGDLITLRTLRRGKQVVFQVCDQGRGIAVEERRKLFRAFHKSAQEAAHTKPGVGLGLALCRRLARALGGDLRIVDSEQGACFELVVG